MVARLRGALFGLLLAGSAAASEQQLTEAKLKALRAEIASASAALKAIEGEQKVNLDALRAVDQAQATIARQARLRAEESARLTALRQALGDEQQALQITIGKQQARIARFVQQAYAGGRGEGLRLLLDPQGAESSLRQLGYLRVLKREREQRIKRLLTDAERLQRLSQATTAANRAFAIAERAAALQQAQLARARQQHDAAVAGIRERMRAQRATLGQLAKDERALLDLLERLTDILADVRGVLDQQVDIKAQRGRLPWPANGAVIQKFGVTLAPGRVSDGILIAARRGSEVRAVAHGRVAFADWLKGFGLVQIVDHGDGVMTLYAHCESLAREVGDWVSAGDVIATVGSSGGNDQAGLYFEVRSDSRPQNPSAWLGRP